MFEIWSFYGVIVRTFWMTLVLACIYKQTENIVDPDQLISEKPTDLDLDLHCFFLHTGY